MAILNDFINCYFTYLPYIMTFGIIHSTFMIFIKRKGHESDRFVSISDFYSSLVGPIIEEILFRDFLRRYMLLFFNITNTNILNSLLFSLLHITNSMSDKQINYKCLFNQLIFTFTSGYIFNLTGNIFVSMALHMTWNTSSILIVFLLDHYLNVKDVKTNERPKTNEQPKTLEELEDKLKMIYSCRHIKTIE